MIERKEFQAVWAHLCRRFDVGNDPDQAVAFYEYLSSQFDTAGFLAAARAVWAKNRFFPRPADFVTVLAGRDWPLVLECAEGFAPPGWTWTEPWGRMSERGRAACKHLGGMDVIRTQAGKDPLRLRQAWLEAFEEAAVEEALALPATSAPERPARLDRGPAELSRVHVGSPERPAGRHV